MRNMKLLFSALVVAFAILGLTKALSTDITMPITFVCLAITMFITAKEYKDKLHPSMHRQDTGKSFLPGNNQS